MKVTQNPGETRENFESSDEVKIDEQLDLIEVFVCVLGYLS